MEQDRTYIDSSRSTFSPRRVLLRRYPLDRALMGPTLILVLALLQVGCWRTSLHEAVEQGDLALVERLLTSEDTDINLRGPANKTPLFIAVEQGHEAILHRLLEAGAEVNVVVFRRTPLSTAVAAGSHTITEVLLAAGADPNLVVKEAPSPLYIAVEQGRTALVELLISAEADVNNPYDGSAPLHVAAARGDQVVIERLLAASANAKATDKQQKTPLHYAASKGHVDIATLLLSKGADVDARDESEVTPLHLASQNGNYDLARLLLSKGASVNAQEKRKWTPLHYAAQRRSRDLTQLLLSRGADARAKNKECLLPGDLMVKEGDSELSDLLPRQHTAPVVFVLDRAFTAEDGHGRLAVESVKKYFAGDVVSIDIGDYFANITTGSALEGFGSVLEYAERNPSKRLVINLSWGSYEFNVVEHLVISRLHRSGVIVVTGAGNDNTDVPFYPSAQDETIAVGAVVEREKGGYTRAPYSNHGAYVDIYAEDMASYTARKVRRSIERLARSQRRGLQTGHSVTFIQIVEMIAVGDAMGMEHSLLDSQLADLEHLMHGEEQILIRYLRQYLSSKGGTSFTAPQIAGIVANMLAANRFLTTEAARALLQKTAMDGNVVNAQAAVFAARCWDGSETYVAPTRPPLPPPPHPLVAGSAESEVPPEVVALFPVQPFDAEGTHSEPTRWGYIDAQGHLTMAPQYEEADVFSEGLARVKQHGRYGYIDRRGQFVIPSRFAGAHRFSEGLAAVELDGKWGFIDRKGDFVIEPRFESAYRFSEGMADARRGRLWGYIDRHGTFVIEPRFESAYRFSDGLASVKIKGRRGYIDKSGHFAIEPTYNNAYAFSEGLAAVERGGKWGYIDKKERFVIPLRYKRALTFSEGLAAVRDGDTWGYIGRDGHFVIPSRFDAADPFNKGLARVLSNGSYHYIDKRGNFIWPPGDK